MRGTSEAPNDIGVQLGPAAQVVTTERVYERDGALLVGQAFRVLERQIEEQAPARRDFLVEPACNRALGHGARQRIARESLRFAPEHIAGKLIEYEHE